LPSRSSLLYEVSLNMQTVDIPPHNCIYVNNINEKIKKPQLMSNLYYVFSQFGQVLEVHAQRSPSLRGQAWIMFDKVDSATQAVRRMNKFMFFGKPLRVNFSKNKSDTLAKRDGDYKVRPKRIAPSKPVSRVSRAPVQAVKKPRTEAPQRSMDESEDSEKTKEETPNKILFIENLPPGTNAMMLQMLFDQYEGYVEARLIAGKKGIAFVEFSDAFHSGRAKETLQGFKITGSNHMKITYARK